MRSPDNWCLVKILQSAEKILPTSCGSLKNQEIEDNKKDVSHSIR